MARMKPWPRTLFLLIDGVGLGADDPVRNPLRLGLCPHFALALDRWAIPLDARMGIGGLPQSASGQTALLTGINTGQLLGRHVQGFPGPSLCAPIRRRNLLRRLSRRGFKVAFANAYAVEKAEEVRLRPHHSVTTVAALSVGAIRTLSDLRRNRAVYHDLTRKTLPRPFRPISPGRAATHLMAVAKRNDFTLFEYFLPDRVGHRGGPEDLRRVLTEFDVFFKSVLRFADGKRNLLILSSDHGHIEEGGGPSHSINPVPLLALGCGADFLKRHARCITDVAPAVLRLYGARRGRSL